MGRLAPMASSTLLAHSGMSGLIVFSSWETPEMVPLPFQEVSLSKHSPIDRQAACNLRNPAALSQCRRGLRPGSPVRPAGGDVGMVQAEDVYWVFAGQP